MRKISSLAAAAMILVSAMSRSHAEVEISYQEFYDALSPYGEWLSVEGYGYCWQPYVDDDWRPYTNGNWIYTDAGWTWASHEKWGWATDHYGRWMLTRDFGWLWVPGYEWGPAWVSWRTGGEYVGWAPLPPEATWQPATGFGPSVEVSFRIGPEYYSFCPVRYFGAPRLRPYIVPRGENVTIVNNTVNVTRITNINNVRVFNNGPDFEEIRHRTEQPIRQARLERREDVRPEVVRAGEVRNQIEGDVLRVVAPRVERSDREAKPPRLAGSVRRDQLVRRTGSEQEPRPRPQMPRSEQSNIPPEPRRSEEHSERDPRLSDEIRREEPPSDRNRRSRALERENRGGESAPDQNKARARVSKRERGAEPEESVQTPPPALQPFTADQQSPPSREPSHGQRRPGDDQGQAASRPSNRKEVRSDREEGSVQHQRQRRSQRSEESIQEPSSPAPQPSQNSKRRSVPERDLSDSPDKQNTQQRRRQTRQEVDAPAQQTQPSDAPPQEKIQQRRAGSERPQKAAPSAERKQSNARSQGGERKEPREISGRSRSQQQQSQVDGRREKKGSSKGQEKKKENEDE